MKGDKSMTIKEIVKNDLWENELSDNIRRFLKQPAFSQTFHVEPIGVVRENRDLVLYLNDLKNDPEISKRGSVVELRFSGPDASAPYLSRAGLTLTQ